jgi:malate dehydrogenase
MRKCAVVGAGGCGSAIAQRLAACGLFDVVVLGDPAAGRAEGRALDIEQASCIDELPAATIGVTLAPGDSYRAIAGSQVVVIATGLSRRPGMRRADLLRANAEVVATAALGVRAFAQPAVVIVLTNPLDEMTALVQAVSGLPAGRVIGQAGILDTARFRSAVARELGVPASEVRAVVLGPHSEEMVPLVSSCQVRGQPLTELLTAGRIAALVERVQQGGTEIIDLLRTGSTSAAPSAAAMRMIRAITADEGAELPVSAQATGEYGIDGVYLGMVAALGAQGVRAIIEHPVTSEELRMLRASAELTRRRQAAMREMAAGMATTPVNAFLAALLAPGVA